MRELALLHHPGALRQAPVAYAVQWRRGTLPLDAWGRPTEDQAAVVSATWRYVGSGYQSAREAWLAAPASSRAREERRIGARRLVAETHAYSARP
jgi:hypothetical protein